MAELLLRRGGTASDSARRIFICALALGTIGLLAQITVTTTRLHDPYDRVTRQVAYLLLALVSGAGAAAFGFRRAVRWSRPALWLTWALLAFLLLPGAAHIAGGSARWIELSGFGHLQPSEVAKVVLILFFSGFAALERRDLGDFREGFLPAMGYLGVTALLVVLEPDLGQTVFIVALGAAVLMVNGLRVRHLLPVFLIGVPLLALFMGGRWKYIGDRLDGFLSGSHYQVQQGLLFLSFGGPFGRKIGESRAHLFVPEIRNDFVLVSIGEQAGFVGCALVVILFLVMFHQGLRLALLARDALGFSVAFGFSFMIALQAAVNVAVVTALVPPKGISLPFVSYGGSSLVVNAVGVGLLLSVAREARSIEEAFPRAAAKHLSHKGEMA